MTERRALRWLLLLGAILPALLSCATVREKTESYLLGDYGRPTQPVVAWLRTVEIASNNLPLSEDYGLVRDSLVAIASRHGFLLSQTQGDQPWIVDLVIHERSYTVDLSTASSVMAVLNVKLSLDDSRSAARVVYSAVTPDSVVSLYQVTEIAEKMFGSLSRALAEEDAKARAEAKASAAAKSDAQARASAESKTRAAASAAPAP